MTITIAAIGCSGPVAAHYIKGFAELGIQVKLLSLSEKQGLPEGVQLVKGSMMNASDVANVLQGVDAAFLVTPMATKNQTESEIKAAKIVLEGAKEANLKHLIYTSVLGSDSLRGVGILDAKYEIEKLIKESGIPCSILRCGTYMEDVFDPRISLLNKGIYLFPIQKEARITYTCQADVPRFVVQELLKPGKTLNKSINFVREDNEFAVAQVEAMLTEVTGVTVRAVPKFPAFYLFKAALPYFNWTEHRFSSVIPLMAYFDQKSYVVDDEEGSDTFSVSKEFPGFELTPLKSHLESLFPKSEES